MKSLINWLVTTVPKRFDNLFFSDLCKDEEWISLPSLIRISFIEQNIQRYIFDDHSTIDKYIETIQNAYNHAEPKKMAKAIYEVIDYALDRFPPHAFDEKINIITRSQESLLRDLVNEKRPDVIKFVDFYLKQKLEIIKTQKENHIYDEREGEQADIDYFNKLKTIYDELFPMFQSLVLSSESGYNEEIIKIYIHLFIETPNLEKSNSENFVPNTLPYLKTQLKRITLNKKFRISEILEIIVALDHKLIELRERLDSSKRILHNLDYKRYYAVKSNIMHIYFKERSICNLEALIKYVKKNYYNNRSKLVFPDKFEDTITDLKRFKKIIEELKIRTILDKNEKGNYKWNLKANELGLFLVSLEKNSLLNKPIENNHAKYSNLICAYFNVSFAPRSLQNSKKSKKFEFISNLK